MNDIIVIGAGASGLFLGAQLPKNVNMIILEKNENPGNKLLLTGKGRCNFSNSGVSKEHYYGDSLGRLDEYFETFGAKDMVNYLEKNGIDVKEEDHGRMFLKSNKSKQLLDFLVNKNHENGHIINLGENVVGITQADESYLVKTTKDSYKTREIVIACGGKSFPQVGGSDFIFQFSNTFGIKTERPVPALSGIITKENLSSLSGSSISAKIQVKDKKGRILYQDEGIILFTHRGISGPLIFNLTLRMSKDYTQLKNITMKLSITQESITKRLLAYLKAPKNLKNYILTLHPKAFKDRETAKVMYGGILLNEVKENFELKKVPGIYVVGEALNITGETGGYNLQRCWSSAYRCAKNFS